MGIRVSAAELYTIVSPGSSAAKIAKTQQAVAKTASDVERGAKERSRVETGNMRNSWQAGPVSGGGLIGADISNPVDYTIHNEFGTWKMSAQPMAIPALDAAAPGFIAAIEQIWGDPL